MLEYTLYHKFLRISGLVLAFVLAFQSGLFSPTTARMTANTQHYLASSVVGVYAQVDPTELNSITAGLTAKEYALAQREKALNERDINVGLNNGSLNDSKTTFVLGVMLFIILVLLVLNYALDYLRYKNQMLVQSLITGSD